MALPIFIPAIVKGAAALSAALGLTALVSSKSDNDEDSFDTSKIKDTLDPYTHVKQAMPLMMATMTKMQQPTAINIPTAENALVLKPEYRTETYVVPDQYNPIKSIIKVEDSQGNRKFVDDSNLYNNAEDVPDPKKPQKNDDKSKDKKGFKKGLQKGWEYTKKVGNVGLQGIGIGLGLSPIVGVPAGIYYGGKALGWWGEDSNNSSTEIDREGTEQAWEDMKVGRKPGQ